MSAHMFLRRGTLGQHKKGSQNLGRNQHFFRRMPTAKAEGLDRVGRAASESSRGGTRPQMLFGSGVGPGRSPSARSEMLKIKELSQDRTNTISRYRAQQTERLQVVLALGSVGQEWWSEAAFAFK